MTDMYPWKVFAPVAVAATVAIGTDAGPELIQIGDVAFPHELHSVDLEIECAECHHDINAAELDTPHDEYFTDFWISCSICHHDGETVAETERCASCHDRSTRDFTDETLSAKVVVHASCWSCHDVGTGSNASRACGECHQGRGKDGAP